MMTKLAICTVASNFSNMILFVDEFHVVVNCCHFVLVLLSHHENLFKLILHFFLLKTIFMCVKAFSHCSKMCRI